MQKILTGSIIQVGGSSASQGQPSLSGLNPPQGHASLSGLNHIFVVLCKGRSRSLALQDGAGGDG